MILTLSIISIVSIIIFVIGAIVYGSDYDLGDGLMKLGFFIALVVGIVGWVFWHLLVMRK